MAPSTLAVLLLLPLLSLSKFARAQGIITLGSSLVAEDGSPSWKSPSGDFAFGFKRIQSKSFLLAIWFDKIPEKTDIWWANAGNLAPEGSKVQLTDKGLILNDPNGVTIWPRVMVNGVVNGSMNDAGNLVLVDKEGCNLWETFSQPTDTLVPTQVLNQGTDINSRASATSYSDGRFLLTMQTDGNLVMYTLPIIDTRNAYWASNTVGSSGRVIFNQTGQIHLIDNKSVVLNTMMNGTDLGQDFYRRAVIDHDGVFRQYVYPKNASLGSGKATGWSSVSSPVPDNICRRMLDQFTSIGVCGLNSYCILGDDQGPRCSCPPGYSYTDPSNKQNGCKQEFLPQSCEEGINDPNLFEMREKLNTTWGSSDYERLGTQEEDFCRQDCLRDCYCDAAIFSDGICRKKRMPLMNGFTDPAIAGKALIKVRVKNSTLNAGKNSKDVLILAGSVLLGSSVFVNFILMGVIGAGLFLIFRKKLIRVILDATALDVNIRCFTYRELEDASNGFKEEIGRGSFGIVYRGVIEMVSGTRPSNSKTEVAIKKLDRMFQECEREFQTEVAVIGQIHHKNLVRLLGYCNEGQNRLLVYEFLSNGTLASFLFGDDMKPSWDQRAQIALDIGKGLLYLHEECSTQIIHCDIKPQNILLDENYAARISDFGLAKLLLLAQTQTNTAIRGTRGYVAPEWFRNAPITVKVDVYSFGTLLLEIICCRRSVDVELGGEEKVILADWAYDCYRERSFDALVENDEEALGDFKRLERFVMVAIWCIQEDPSLRPTMKKVMLMLEGIIQVSIPPCPFSFSSVTTV